MVLYACVVLNYYKCWKETTAGWGSRPPAGTSRARATRRKMAAAAYVCAGTKRYARKKKNAKKAEWNPNLIIEH